MKSILVYMKNHKWFIVLLTLLLVGGYFYFGREKSSPFETAEVKRGDVIQEVSVTGRVNSESEVNIAFERSGRVSSQPRAVGTHVDRGDTLVRVDASELIALRSQAEANLDVELANLSELKKGSRPEDVGVSRAQVESARSSVDSATRSAFDKLRASYTVSDDAIHNITDQFFVNPRVRTAQVAFPVNDAKLALDIVERRITLETLLGEWESDMRLWNEQTDVKAVMKESEDRLGVVKEFLEKMALAINGLAPSSSLTQTTIDGWKLDISGVRSSVNNALSVLVAQEEKYYASVEALKIAEQQLALKVAGPTEGVIAAQTARIASVRASIANYNAQIAKTVLTAPFSGIITKQDAKFGETVSPNVPLVTLMSDSEWKIEANVPEVDVAKITLGNPAKVSFDAYGTELLFDALVTVIDPAETVIEGVSTYKITLRLTKDDDRVRSGMTANIDILTSERKNVLYIPSRAVVTREGAKFVRTQHADGMTANEIPVELGLRGSDGNIEVLSGLTEGMRVITFEVK